MEGGLGNFARKVLENERKTGKGQKERFCYAEYKPWRRKGEVKKIS